MSVTRNSRIRTLQRAVEAFGGAKNLAAYLNVALPQLEDWIAGRVETPPEVFGAALDIVAAGPFASWGGSDDAETAEHHQARASRLQETADRIVGGADHRALIDDLAELNLTRRAAKMVVGLARISAVLRDFLPPYQSRWLGYTLAFAFAATAMVCIGRISDHLAEGYQDYALLVAFWIAGDLAARPRRRPTVRGEG